MNREVTFLLSFKLKLPILEIMVNRDCQFIILKVKVINVGLVVELLQNHFSQDVHSEVSTSWSEKQLIDAIEGCTADSLYYAELSDHSDAITALSLSRDATCLGSASLDGKVCIYSLVSRMAGNMKYKLRLVCSFGLSIIF